MHSIKINLINRIINKKIKNEYTEKDKFGKQKKSKKANIKTCERRWVLGMKNNATSQKIDEKEQEKNTNNCDSSKKQSKKNKK